jgi:hypothetical protein
MPMITDPRIEALWASWQGRPRTATAGQQYVKELTAILAQRAREHPGFEDYPYTPLDGPAALHGRINYFKRSEGFGFIGWHETPDFWFAREHVEDDELRRMLLDPETHVSGTPILFCDGGLTREGATRRTAIKIRRRLERDPPAQ